MSGPLKNARHERFAQELAKGKSQSQAYVDAGYQPDTGAASRLSGNVSIAARIVALKEGAAKRTEVTVASITARLHSIADKAEQVKGASGLAVSRAAMMDVAKLNGLIIDKAQVSVDLTKLDDEDLDALAAILGKTS